MGHELCSGFFRIKSIIAHASISFSIIVEWADSAGAEYSELNPSAYARIWRGVP
jgi:hypothetical protein